MMTKIMKRVDGIFGVSVIFPNYPLLLEMLVDLFKFIPEIQIHMRSRGIKFTQREFVV
jgi:hypothetical protein